MLAGVFLKEGVGRNDERGYELALVGYDNDLLYVFIHEKLCLYSLWSHVFTVGCLEEILYSLCDVKLAIFHIAGITSMEISVFGEGLCVEMVSLVVSLCDCRTFEENLAVLANLDVDAFYRAAYRAYGERLVAMVAGNGSKALCESVADNHINADGMDEYLHFRRYGSTGGREDVRLEKAELLTDKREYGLVCYLVFQGKSDWRAFAVCTIFYVVAGTKVESSEKEFSLERRDLIHLFLYAGIYLFPESWNGRHTGRVGLTH